MRAIAYITSLLLLIAESAVVRSYDIVHYLAYDGYFA